MDDTQAQWTEDDAAALAALNAKKAAAQKTALGPVVAVLGNADDVTARIATLEAAKPHVDIENQQRIDRIIINLRFDALPLIAAAAPDPAPGQ